MAATTHVADAMQSASSVPAASTAPVLRRLPWPQRILVASGGTASAEPALAVARAMARRSSASVELLAVFSPRIPLPPEGQSRCEAPDRIAAATMLRRVRSQRDAVVRSGPTWPMRFESGDPRQVIVRVAREHGADLVIVGIGRKDPRHRRVGDITAAVVANHLDVPVYAAMQGCSDSPSRVAVLLPDGRMHAPTLHAAVESLMPHGHLIIVRPTAAAVPDPADCRPHADVDSESLALGSAEVLLGGLDVQSVELDGDIVAAMVQFAQDNGIDLIAVPMRGASGPVRSLLQPHAAPLLLAAMCSILVVPDPPVHVDEEFRAEPRSAGLSNQIEGGAAC